jgi:hypothetical protein
VSLVCEGPNNIDLCPGNVDTVVGPSADADHSSPADSDNDWTAKGLGRRRSLDEMGDETSPEDGQ